MSVKNSNEPIWNGTRDLPACSTMSHPVEIRDLVIYILLFLCISATARAIPSADCHRHSVVLQTIP